MHNYQAGQREGANRNTTDNTTVLTFIVEHFTGVQGEVGGAEGGLVAASIHVDLLVPGVGLALEAGPVDEEGVRLDTTNSRVNIEQDIETLIIIFDSHTVTKY